MPYRATRLLRRVEGKGPYNAGDLLLPFRDGDDSQAKHRLVKRGQIEFVSDEQVEADGLTTPGWDQSAEEPEPEVEEDEEFPCRFCDEVLKSKGGRTRHENSAHADEVADEDG